MRVRSFLGGTISGLALTALVALSVSCGDGSSAASKSGSSASKSVPAKTELAQKTDTQKTTGSDAGSKSGDQGPAIDDAGKEYPLVEARKRRWEAVELTNEAKRLAGQKKYQEAAIKADDALRLAPDHIPAVVLRVELFRRLQQFEEALGYIDEKLHGRPGHPPFLEQKARTQLASGDVEGSLLTIDQILALDVLMPGVRLLRAQCFAYRKDGPATVLAIADAIENGYLNAKRLREGPEFAFVREDVDFELAVSKIDALMAKNRRALEDHLAKGEKPEEKIKTEEFLMPEHAEAKHSESALYFVRSNLLVNKSKPKVFETFTLDKKPFTLDVFRGKTVLVQFWGMWSEASQQQVLRLKDTAKELREKGEVEIVLLHYADPRRTGVNDDPHGECADWLKNNGIDFPTGRTDVFQAQDFGAQVFPSTFFLGPDLKSYMHLFGPIEADLMTKMVTEIAEDFAKRKVEKPE